MDLQQMLQIIQPILGYQFDKEQLEVISHDEGPLWVVAGPGSGKTEVLVIRTLKVVFVDKINPKSIIITTFTEKAAKNLFDRILNCATYIFKQYPDLERQLDIHSLRIGTLHSLCSEIMLEYKYTGYENYRLLDELEQNLFVYENSALAKDGSEKFLPLWNALDYLFSYWDPVSRKRGWNNRDRPPSRWRRTRAEVSLFNRIIEDLIDINSMQNADEFWLLLIEAYEDYKQNLEQHQRCDFAHLQKKFLDFLKTPFGEFFLNGDNSDRRPGVTHIMVDEYQDTNPIQEAIYLELAKKSHNLCVVGDDDQALYRFRGGTVDCMVTFDKACKREWGISLNQVRKIFLNSNYRSHSDIVGYYDEYITSFEVMGLDGARVSEKPSLNPRSQISGNFPAVAYITGRTINETANKFAEFVRDLLDKQIIQLPSQCALLMRSVREKDRWAGPFANALRNVDIQPYNPRSRTFLEQEEIMAALGTFISIVDPELSALSRIWGPGIRNMVRGWVDEYRNIVTRFPELDNYVNKSLQRIGSTPTNNRLDVNISEILYRILAHEPFSIWEADTERSYRLGQLTKVFETYSSVPYPGSPGSNRGELRTSSSTAGQTSLRWRQNFYYSLVGLLAFEGLNDPEEEELITPPDRLPIMTVHQAKGLEFPFIFVYRLSLNPKVDSSIRLEEDLSQFRHSPRQVIFTPEQRAEQDLIRFYYVAYSRAQHALIHLVPQAHIRSGGTGFISQDVAQFRNLIMEL